jgi:hypothetical protein
MSAELSHKQGEKSCARSHKTECQIFDRIKLIVYKILKTTNLIIL